MESQHSQEVNAEVQRMIKTRGWRGCDRIGGREAYWRDWSQFVRGDRSLQGASTGPRVLSTQCVWTRQVGSSLEPIVGQASRDFRFGSGR